MTGSSPQPVIFLVNAVLYNTSSNETSDLITIVQNNLVEIGGRHHTDLE